MNQQENEVSMANIIIRLEELESKWKIDPSVEGIQNMVSLYGVNEQSDFIPQNVEEEFKKGWNTYVIMRRDLAECCEDDSIPADIEFRCNKIQESIFHSKNSMFSFMRASNCNGAYPTPKTPETLFWYSPLDKSSMTGGQALIIYMLGKMRDGPFRKMEGYVYKQVFMNGYPTHAWKELCEVKDMVWRQCPKETSWEMWKTCNSGGNFESCVKYLSDCNDVEFPDLKIKRRVWSFNDGIYDASDDSFKLYTEEISSELVSCKIIEKDFIPVFYKGVPVASPKLTLGELKTPLFNSIFEPQGWDEDMLFWIKVFIGRLFYEVGEMDSWQVIPFLKGVAGTGKSTIIKIVQMMYNPRDVGVISNNIQKQFGLSTIFEKTVFVIPEVKSDFAMDQADFQSMVTGEELSMAVKFGNPLTGQWTTPGIMAGNEAAGWEDKSGSISRRIVVFDFPNKVPLDKLNPNLIDEIKDTELPTIIRACSLAYQIALDKYSCGDIWAVMPSRVCEEKKRLQFSTNPLYAFVNSDSLIIDPDEYTLENIFITKLKAFALLKFPMSTITFTQDFYASIFNDMGLSIKTDTLPWPRTNYSNIQTQSYVFGCKTVD